MEKNNPEKKATPLSIPDIVWDEEGESAITEMMRQDDIERWARTDRPPAPPSVIFMEMVEACAATGKYEFGSEGLYIINTQGAKIEKTYIGNFIVRIVNRIVFFDGEEAWMEYEVEGVTNADEPLEPIRIRSEEFNRVTINEYKWGRTRTEFAPIHKARRRFREAVDLISAPLPEVRRGYAATGWLMENDERVFSLGDTILRSGGRTTWAQESTVHLFPNYDLQWPPLPGRSLSRDALVSFFRAVPLRVSIILFSLIFLAPSLPLFDELGCRPRFITMLVSKAEPLRISILQAVQSFFCIVHADSKFVSILDSAIDLRKKLYAAKDVLLVIDSDSTHHCYVEKERAKWNIKNMVSDLRIQHANQYTDIGGKRKKVLFPRGLSILSCSEFPMLEPLDMQSVLPLFIDEDEYDLYQLDQLLDYAYRNILETMVLGYILQLIRQDSEISAMLAASYEGAYRDFLDKHPNLSEEIAKTLACLSACFEVGINSISDLKIHEEIPNLVIKAKDIFHDYANTWGNLSPDPVREDTLAQRYIMILHELVATHEGYFWDDTAPDTSTFLGECLGFVDDNFYYILPGTIKVLMDKYETMHRGSKAQNRNRTLESLAEEGFLLWQEDKNGKRVPSYVKHFNNPPGQNKTHRVMKFVREKVDALK